MKIIGIYKITNIINNKVYIGSSSNIKKRWSAHKRLLNKGIHHSPYLQSSWNKYGPESFTFNIMKTCKKENILLIEDFIIKKNKSFNREFGYNNTEGVRVFSENTKTKWRKTRQFTQKESTKLAWIAHMNNLNSYGQYDLEGNLIKVWKNSTEVNNLLNIDQSFLNQASKNINYTAKGFMWRVVNKQYPEIKITPFNGIKNRRIIYEVNNVKKVFHGTKEISEFFKVTPSTINKWLRNSSFKLQGKLYRDGI